jgi:hypothetical protein
LKVVL